MTKFEKGHKFYPRSAEGKLSMKEKMSGENNPMKRLENRMKISCIKKGNKGRRGLPHSEETKEKISKAHIGKKKPWAGLFLTEKGRETLRNRRGEKSPSWKGGISSLYVQVRNHYKYRQWRSDIFTRDNFTCVLCGRKGYLEADHYPKPKFSIFKEYQINCLEDALKCEELWNTNNGRTLCKPCHVKETKKLWKQKKITKN